MNRIIFNSDARQIALYLRSEYDFMNTGYKNEKEERIFFDVRSQLFNIRHHYESGEAEWNYEGYLPDAVVSQSDDYKKSAIKNQFTKFIPEFDNIVESINITCLPKKYIVKLIFKN